MTSAIVEHMRFIENEDATRCPRSSFILCFSFFRFFFFLLQKNERLCRDENCVTTMKISRGRNVSVLLKSLFKRIAKSREYFNYKRKYLLDYYLRFYRRRRHSVVGNVLKFRDKRAVIAHNVLRIKGGLRRRCRRPHTRIFYGAPITTRPIRKKKKRKQEKLPVQLQNVSSTTKPAINEKTESNGEDISLVQIDGAAAMVAPAANSIVITNSEKTCASMNEDISTVTVPLETTEPVNELEDNSTNNIWNLDLATVALEMTDENLPSSDDDTPNGYTNGPGMAYTVHCNHPGDCRSSI